MSGNLVLTPGGYRHPSLVHRVERGQAVRVADGKLHLMNLVTKETRELVRPMLKPGDVPGFGTGWITYSDWQNNTGNPVTSFRTTWTVPPAPKTKSGQTIFLFNGIDPVDPSQAILQPVLQWGSSAAGGGEFWSVANWFVHGNGQALFTALVPVNPGQSIQGIMTLTGQAGGKFDYTSEFAGIDNKLTVQNVDELTWCNETLEAYGITKCSDYPDADFTAMLAIDLETNGPAPVTWTPVNMVTDCGQHTIVVSNSSTNGQVNLYYRQPQPQVTIDNIIREAEQYVQILFGVTNDGGGVGIIGGHIIHIPPWDPDGPIYREVVAVLGEVVRGLAVDNLVRGSLQAGGAVRGANLAMIAERLELAARSVRAVGEKMAER